MSEFGLNFKTEAVVEQDLSKREFIARNFAQHGCLLQLVNSGNKQGRKSPN